MRDDLFALGREAEIILLDYQCTLCLNGTGRQAWLRNPDNRNRNYADWIRQETMREWLIPLIGGRHVILITARRSSWETVTLRRIREVLNWQPDEWYFNPDGDYLPPQQHKERVIHSAVFPRFGTSEQTAYLALESNRLTRAMYQRNGVTAIRIDMPLEELPLV